MIYFWILWVIMIAANLYMAKVNTDTFYKFLAQKRYQRANQARILVVLNLALALGISVFAVWVSF
jgi:hypothetical protein